MHDYEQAAEHYALGIAIGISSRGKSTVAEWW